METEITEMIRQSSVESQNFMENRSLLSCRKKEPTQKKISRTTLACRCRKDTAKLFIEFGGNKFAADEIVEKCKAAYKADNSRKQVRSIEVYVKPEDNKAYYVVNGKADGLYIDL